MSVMLDCFGIGDDIFTVFSVGILAGNGNINAITVVISA